MFYSVGRTRPACWCLGLYFGAPFGTLVVETELPVMSWEVVAVVAVVAACGVAGRVLRFAAAVTAYAVVAEARCYIVVQRCAVVEY